MIYLNNAATSWPKAFGLGDYMKSIIEQVPAHGSRATGNGPGQCKVDCRAELAELMGIRDKNRIVYMENATRALNTALLGFPWKQGDVVLTTAAEHNSVLRPLYFLQKKGVIRYYVLPVEEDGTLSLKKYKEALQSLHPRMIVLTHASNVTGAVNDIGIVAELARKKNAAVLVDASQTMGTVPVLPDEWEADMIAFTGHKYLLGPQGTGGLYVREGITLEPVITGGTGIHSDEDEMPAELPGRLEAGTQNEQAFSGLGMAVRWGLEHPFLMRKMEDEIDFIEEELLKTGVNVISVRGKRTPILSFTVKGFSPDEVGDILNSNYEIVCRTGLHCAPLINPWLGVGATGTVRISLSRFTKPEEIESFLQAMKEIVNG